MKSRLSKLGALLVVGLMAAACARPERQEVYRPYDPDVQAMNEVDQVRLRQYSNKGRGLYAVHCANCHMDSGEGLKNLYPPLANSDYLLEDVQRAICIARYGLAGEITVNGKSYDQPMQPIPSLRALEVAAILTYVYTELNDTTVLISAKDAQDALAACDSLGYVR